ncbi:MAG: zinc dependent phospholipase C family protein [Clostridiales bacterium]|nr:zinc dependent phospholipase C family protein [Clostridiales bacterium]
MNSKNHVLIGTLVYEYIGEKYGVVLDYESFIRGNTCPDHSLSFLRPHRLRCCKGMVQRKTKRLCRADWDEIGTKVSKKAGILCHYYADFVCLAHNPGFGGGLTDHRRYEKELLRYMNAHYDRFRGVDYVPSMETPKDAAEICDHMRSLLRQKPVENLGMAEELLYAVRACAELVLLVFFAAAGQGAVFAYTA